MMEYLASQLVRINDNSILLKAGEIIENERTEAHCRTNHHDYDELRVDLYALDSSTLRQLWLLIQPV